MSNWERIRNAVKEVLPSTGKTTLWMIKITVGVSFAMMLLKYFNILPWVSEAIGPIFKYFGLPGSAALAYLSGYFVNCYSAIAVVTSLGLDARATTIIATMVLCSHSMILETAVLRKTGASSFRMVLVRTLSALLLGFILNLVLPGAPAAESAAAVQTECIPFMQMFTGWLLSTLKLCILMTLIIFALNILQKLLNEFGYINVIARALSPLMYLLGLPRRTAFLWLVANVVGLSYGAAAMLDEINGGNISHRDVLLLDSHICVSHSNLEDLTLMAAIGGVWWIMLCIRVLMAVLLVWEHRIEMALVSKTALQS